MGSESGSGVPQYRLLSPRDLCHAGCSRSEGGGHEADSRSVPSLFCLPWLKRRRISPISGPPSMPGWRPSLPKRSSSRSATWNLPTFIRSRKIPSRTTSGSAPPMTSSSGNEALSSWTAQPPGLPPLQGPRPVRRLPRRSPSNFRKRTFTSSCARSTRGNVSRNSWWRQGSRSAGRPGWSPSDPDITAAVFAMGFACRVAMAFGGIKPGDFRKILIYNKDRIFAFVMPLGYVTDEWYANAAGAINWGFPTIADTPIPEILPTGICTYEHVVSNIPHDQIVQRAVEVRGLKVQVANVPIPVSYGPAFEGERVRGEDIYLECGGGRTHAVEWVTSKNMDEVEDGKVEVIGPDLDQIKPPAQLPLAIVAEVAGRQMQEDFEPILERQIHHLINYAQGIMHIGQRDIAWLRVGKGAVEKGFRLCPSGRDPLCQVSPGFRRHLR